MRPAPTYLSYETGGQSEFCLSFDDTGPVRTILIVPPLFDEMNRTRRMLVEAMHALAERGVRTILPDLPGCNESMADIAEQDLRRWQDAMRAASAQLGATHIASVRGGALLVNDIGLLQWRLAPAKGMSILKTMLRTRIAADREVGRTSTIESLLADAQNEPLELAGYRLSAEMLFALENAGISEAESACEVSLADIGGTALWLRAEPQDCAEMSAAIAVNLDRWSASCGG